MKKALIALAIIFIINVFSLYYGWYLEWDWFDISMHYLGGFFVAMFMAYYLRDRLVPGINIKNALIIVGATLFIGVVWEFAEFIANQILIEPFYRWFGLRTYFMGDLKDTITDLLMDTLGSITFMFLHFIRGRNPHQR